MTRGLLAVLLALFTLGSAMAEDSCATRAVGKDGKPLTGAAKTSFIKRCCDDAAVGKDGQPLSGAAKTSFMKKCQAG